MANRVCFYSSHFARVPTVGSRCLFSLRSLPHTSVVRPTNAKWVGLEGVHRGVGGWLRWSSIVAVCRLRKTRVPNLYVSWQREKSEYYIAGSAAVSCEATPHAARWLRSWMRRVLFACACACAPQTVSGTVNDTTPFQPPHTRKRAPEIPTGIPHNTYFFYILAVLFAAEEVTSRMGWQCNWLHFSFVSPPCVLLCHGFARRWAKINDDGVLPSESLLFNKPAKSRIALCYYYYYDYERDEN